MSLELCKYVEGSTNTHNVWMVYQYQPRNCMCRPDNEVILGKHKNNFEPGKLSRCSPSGIV